MPLDRQIDADGTNRGGGILERGEDEEGGEDRLPALREHARLDKERRRPRTLTTR